MKTLARLLTCGLAFLALAAGCSLTPAHKSLFAGTWSCTLDTVTVADGGTVSDTVTLQFVENGDGTFTSTEQDDARALPCTIQYVDPGPDLQVSPGQTCPVGGVDYSIDGTVQATSATMFVNFYYYNGGPSAAVTGYISANCVH